MRAAARMRQVVLTGLLLVGVCHLVFGADYEIGPRDVLRIVVMGQESMTGSFTVDREGMLTFPVLGKIRAAEHTPAELERKLTTLLADGYLKRPQVAVLVAEYASQRVFVTGEVQRPGQYVLKSDRSLLALLGDIGALGVNAGHEVVVVRPPAPSTAETAPEDPTTTPDAAEGKGEPSPPPTPSPTLVVPGLPFVAPGSEVFRVNLFELQAGMGDKNVLIQAGDTVFFPRAAQVYVLGSVARPGPLRFEEGMTVLQALTLAGGVTDRGAAGRTKVVRLESGKKVERKTKPGDVLKPEDTLMVPERFF